MLYLMTHSTHFIYGYMVSDIWLKTILIVRKETRCRHIGYSYQLTARVLLYAPSHRQDNTYHGLCYTSRGALAGTRNSSMGPPLTMKSMPWRTTSNLSATFVLLSNGCLSTRTNGLKQDPRIETDATGQYPIPTSSWIRPRSPSGDSLKLRTTPGDVILGTSIFWILPSS